MVDGGQTIDAYRELTLIIFEGYGMIFHQDVAFITDKDIRLVIPSELFYGNCVDVITAILYALLFELLLGHRAGHDNANFLPFSCMHLCEKQGDESLTLSRTQYERDTLLLARETSCSNVY